VYLRNLLFENFQVVLDRVLLLLDLLCLVTQVISDFELGAETHIDLGETCLTCLGALSRSEGLHLVH
jgi:hypothetical protein